jgi:hypothetical protein
MRRAGMSLGQLGGNLRGSEKYQLPSLIILRILMKKI